MHSTRFPAARLQACRSVAIVTLLSLEETYDSLHGNSWDLQTAIWIIIYSFKGVFTLFIWVELSKNSFDFKALCTVCCELQRGKRAGFILCVALGFLQQTVSMDASMQRTWTEAILPRDFTDVRLEMSFCPKFSVYTSTGEMAQFTFQMLCLIRIIKPEHFRNAVINFYSALKHLAIWVFYCTRARLRVYYSAFFVLLLLLFFLDYVKRIPKRWNHVV